MKSLILITILVSNLSNASVFDCKTDNGGNLDFQIQNEGIQGTWDGNGYQQKNTHKVIDFKGKLSSVFDDSSYFNVSDPDTGFNAGLVLTQGECHRGGCYYKVVINQSTTRYPYKFTCKESY